MTAVVEGFDLPEFAIQPLVGAGPAIAIKPNLEPGGVADGHAPDPIAA